MSFSVKLKPADYVKRRSVTGPIWLEMNGQQFPIDVWYDFPVAILGFWLDNMKPLLTNRATQCECPFMDGPYRFDVTARKQRHWIVTFIRDDLDGEKRLLEGEVDPRILISEVLLSANTVVKLCRQKGWESEDLATLQDRIKDVTLAAHQLHR